VDCGSFGGTGGFVEGFFVFEFTFGTGGTFGTWGSSGTCATGGGGGDELELGEVGFGF
jgi:hypothetical protein